MAFALGTAFADTSWPSATAADDNSILANLLSYTMAGASHNTPAPAPAPVPQGNNYNLPGATYSAQPFSSVFDPVTAAWGGFNNFVFNYAAAGQMNGDDSADNSILLSLLSFTVPAGWIPPVIAPPGTVPAPQTASLPLTPVLRSVTVNDLVDNPEPGTWGSMALGFVFLVFLTRRTKKSRVR
jgi:hypothetical protein